MSERWLDFWCGFRRRETHIDDLAWRYQRPMPARSWCLLVVGILGGSAAVCVSMLLAALMTHLPGFGHWWVFLGADLVLSGLSAWPLWSLLERVGAEWDRQDQR